MKTLTARLRFYSETQANRHRIRNKSRRRADSGRVIKSAFFSFFFFACVCSTATAMEPDSQTKKDFWLELGWGGGEIDIQNDDAGRELGVLLYLGGTLRKDKHLFSMYRNSFYTDDRDGISETGIKYGRYWENRWLFVSAMTGISFVNADSFDKEYSSIGIPADVGAFLKIGFMSIGLKYAGNISDEHLFNTVSIAMKVNF